MFSTRLRKRKALGTESGFDNTLTIGQLHRPPPGGAMNDGRLGLATTRASKLTREPAAQVLFVGLVVRHG